MINKTDRSALINTEQQAALKGDIKYFLKPFFTFRLYVKFKKDGKACHFYGNEHQCTYQQLRRGHVKNITLNKLKGYTGLIELVEKTWRNKLTSATIYMRKAGSESFDIVCRRWYKGEWEEIQDPVLTDNDSVTLFYFFKDNRLQITTEDPAAADFKSQLNNALTKDNSATANDK